MGGASFNDNVHFRDSVKAGLTDEVIDAIAPCPDCGAETKPHGEAPRASEDERICSKGDCRKVQTGVVERNVQNEPRFPCSKCGCETKVKVSGVSGPTPSRICSDRADCGKVFDVT